MLPAHYRTELIKGGEPFLMMPQGKPTGAGCLCIHGLTATPQEMRWLGQYLAERGMMVIGPRLAGHAADPTLMHRSRWQEWALSALDGYHMLRAHCDQVFVLGLSMGGVTALYLSSQEQVAGVVAFAPAYRLFFKQAKRTHRLRLLRFAMKKVRPDDDPLYAYMREQQQQRGEAPIGRVEYPEHTAAGISELVRYQEALEPRLGKITAPVMLIFAEQDGAIPLSTMGLLKSQLTGSKAVETLVVKDGNHVITNDRAHQQAFDAAWQFIQKWGRF